MPKQRDRKKPIYAVGEVNINQDFPSDDILATDIARLMAAHNDLTHVTEWMDAFNVPPRQRARGLIWQGRFYLQLRLVAAFLHEMLCVFRQMKEEAAFNNLKIRLDQDAIAAMAYLDKVADGSHKAVSILLHKTRNRSTFHYNRDVFMKGLKRLGGKAEKFFLVVRGRKQGNEEIHDVHIYYPFADDIRTDFSFGPRPQGDSWPEYESIRTVLGQLRIFLAGTLAAYRQERGLAKLEIVEESCKA